MPLHYLPITIERLPDLQRFSSAHGKFRYCSCMRWRLSSGDFSRSSKEERIAALDKLICDGVPIGVLGYTDDEPVAWCSIAPRECYEALNRSRTLPPIDDEPVWSVVCFFVDRHFRRQGATLGLLNAAVDYARSWGATIVEGYPIEPDSTSYTYMGSPETFRRAGFQDMTPTDRIRRIMRIQL